MAQTLPNVILPAGTWVDIYAETGISVGTQIIVENVANSEIRLLTRVFSPPDGGQTTGYNLLRPYQEKINETGDNGAFAWSSNIGVLNVRIA